MADTSKYYHDKLTLPDILRRAASSGAITGFIDDKGTETTLSYADLLAEAEKINIGLRNAGIVSGDKIIIASECNRDSIVLLWAAFLGGIIPTVLQPPLTFSGYNPPVHKLLNVSAQLDNPPVFMSRLPQTNEHQGLRVMTMEQLDCSGKFTETNIEPGTVAFIQYSSGSTGDPKGIMLSHSNIMVNLDAIRIGLDFRTGNIVGNWMPLFHDMGLIGYHLTPLYCSIDQWHTETVDFIKNPGLWLDMLTKKKVKITGCPNFGLALTLRHIKRMRIVPDWDFSSLQGLLNGAEPISVQIMLDFVKALEPFKFHPNAMMPVYGLAEVTLAATFTPLMEPSVITAFNAIRLDRDGIAEEVSSDHPAARQIVSVGLPLNDIEIKIANLNGKNVPVGNAGLVFIKGSSVTNGYYNRLEESEKAFTDGWFNTGDIGFQFQGNYYISGRFKDIIFKNGRNYFANDLEELVCTIDGITYGKVCFAGYTDKNSGQEKVVAFLAGSPGEKADALFVNMRNLLRSSLGITLDELVMVRSNEIPKTSSGKLQRYKLLQRYLADGFKPEL